MVPCISDTSIPVYDFSIPFSEYENLPFCWESPEKSYGLT